MSARKPVSTRALDVQKAFEYTAEALSLCDADFTARVLNRHIALTESGMEDPESQINDLTLNLMHYIAETDPALTDVYQSRDAKQIATSVMARLLAWTGPVSAQAQNDPLAKTLRGLTALIEQSQWGSIQDYLGFKQYEFVEELNASY